MLLTRVFDGRCRFINEAGDDNPGVMPVCDGKVRVQARGFR
ncbi:hypothetical protein [Paraburkholderia eburnea]|nr:hypothetical protein [Paraburkholderia eburnea]